MKRPALAIAAIACIVAWSGAQAGSISRTYNYFSIGGTTLGEIEAELQRRGPKLDSTGSRHPGATRMEFNTRVGYREADDHCEVVEAVVSIDADVFLPRWRNRKSAEFDTALMWDTLSADIKRHEEGHIVIARTNAGRMERELLRVRGESCEAAAQEVAAINARILAEHDREQARYDRIENINFESRMLRLLDYRLERIMKAREDGR